MKAATIINDKYAYINFHSNDNLFSPFAKIVVDVVLFQDFISEKIKTIKVESNDYICALDNNITFIKVKYVCKNTNFTVEFKIEPIN
jgi:hypothetical protein